MSFIDFILEPLTYPFMLRALAVVVIVGVLNAVVGTFVVLRGMSFYGSALSHAILPGVAVGYLLGNQSKDNLFWWALLAAAVSTVLIGWIRHDVRLKEDVAIGITFSGMLALGVLLISTTTSYSTDLTHFLFGNILAVSDYGLVRTLIAAVILLIVVGIFFKRLLLVSFDPEHARGLNLPVKRLDILLLAIIAVTIVVSLQTVGIALMTAMLVTPAATGYIVGDRIRTMMLTAGIAAVVSGVGGLYASYAFDFATGAAIVLVMILIFALVWGVKKLM